MKHGLEFTYRPPSYWCIPDAIFASIKGALRRRAICDAINEGRLERLPAGLLSDGLPDEARRLLGAIHPALLGGEYLPDTEEHEVEIARISYDSVTADVISIRARPVCGRIKYRIVDEYDWQYRCRPTWTRRPLAFRQLIRLIDTAEDVGNGYQGLVKGLGKTIETALILRELASRGELNRALMIVPAGLVDNWRRELNETFNLNFEVFGSEGDVTDRKSNAFIKHNRLIARLSFDVPLWRREKKTGFHHLWH